MNYYIKITSDCYIRSNIGNHARVSVNGKIKDAGIVVGIATRDEIFKSIRKAFNHFNGREKGWYELEGGDRFVIEEAATIMVVDPEYKNGRLAPSAFPKYQPKYFDLHLHSAIKKTFLKDATNVDAWDEIRVHDSAIDIEDSFAEMINSQSNLTMLKMGGMHIAVVAIHALEKAYAGNVLFQDVLPFVSPLSRSYMVKIQGQKIDYNSEMMNDYNALIASKDADDEYRNFVTPNNYDQIDPNKLNVILSIEGSHSLYSLPDLQPSEKADFNPIANQADIDNFRNNFQNIRSIGHKIFHLTLIHLTRQHACTHAFAVRMEMRNNLPLVGSSPLFKPGGAGLTELAKILCKDAYTPDADGHIVIIDIKHMSWLSRMQFYQWRNDNGYADIPIIASHMGVTGYSGGIGEDGVFYEKVDSDNIAYWIVYLYQKPAYFNGTYFNPFSINLFDTDIREILKSDGLIGVSMDQRIVGEDTIEEEYFSVKEWNKEQGGMIKYYTIKTRNEIREYRRSDDYIFKPKKYNEFALATTPEELIDPNSNIGLRVRANPAWFFLNNVLQIVKVGLTMNLDGKDGRRDVWNNICLGSDYDGLINPLDTAIGVNSLPDFVNQCKTVLIAFAGTGTHNRDFNIGNPIDRIDQIFMRSGKEFLRKYFRPMSEWAANR